MKRSLVTSLIVITVALALGFGAVRNAMAAVAFEHFGSTDPTTEGFTADGTPPGAADPGPPANWRLAPIGPNGAAYDYTSNPAAVGTAMTDSTGWTFTMTAKLTANRAPSAAMVRLKDATNRFELHMLDSNYVGSGANTGAGLYYYSNTVALTKIGSVNPTDGFHTYQMILDPINGVNDATDSLKFYVDGVLAATILRSGVQGAGGAPQAFFGKATSSGSNNTDQQYAWVRLESGQHIYSDIIPEPTSIALLGSACLGMALRRRANWYSR